MENPTKMITAPLKAPSKPLTEAQIASLQFPYYASHKKDGIRCLIHPTLGPVSGKFLPIPNHYIREQLRDLMPTIVHLDGELLIPGLSFNENQSIFMSRWHIRQKDFRFMVFDHFQTPDNTYGTRSAEAHFFVSETHSPHIEWLEHTLIHTLADLLLFEQLAVLKGEEGIMLNRPGGQYKSGRSTLNEGLLLKIVRHVRDEAIIMGFEEQQENCNAATLNELGHTKRSKHQDNLRGKRTLGALICMWNNYELRIGTGEGLDNVLRQHIWNNQEDYLERIITFKYKPFGMKDVPRHPIFCGFRKD